MKTGYPILDNWEEIDREFERWNRTINIGSAISLAIAIIGAAVSTALLFLFPIGPFLALIGMFITGIVSLFNLFVLTQRKINNHTQRIDELKTRSE